MWYVYIDLIIFCYVIFCIRVIVINRVERYIKINDLEVNMVEWVFMNSRSEVLFYIVKLITRRIMF